MRKYMSDKYSELLISHRRELHKIPETSFTEFKTREYLLKKLNSLDKLEIIEIEPTGILALYRNNPDNSEFIAFRADMDGLPVKEKTNLDFSSEMSGNMHACGHDFHMSILLTFAEYLNDCNYQKNIALVFQPAEEGQGGALKILANERFNELNIQEIYAVHNTMDFPVGAVGFNNHKMFAGTLEIKLKLKGAGGHSAYYNRMNDLNTAASMLNLMLNSIPSRMIDPVHETIVSSGQFCGITQPVCNILPSEFDMKVTVRSYDDNDLDLIKKKIDDMCQAICLAYDISYEYEIMSEYAPVINDPVLTEKMVKLVGEIEELVYIDCEPKMTGEDFGFYTREIPGMIIWLGAGYKDESKNRNLHTADYSPVEEALKVGFELFKNILEA